MQKGFSRLSFPEAPHPTEIRPHPLIPQTMKLSILILPTAFALTTLAAPTDLATAAAYEVPALFPLPRDANTTVLDARALYNDVWRDVKLCTQANQRGKCFAQRIKANTQCYNLPADFNDKVSSMTTSRAICFMFRNERCDMRKELPRRVEAPGVQDFKLIGLDNAASSFRCQYYNWQ